MNSLFNRVVLAICLLLFAVPAFAVAVAPDDPESELAAFKLRDGFEAKLFASEADGIVKPIQMRFDPQGRLWVACSTIYPQLQPGQKPNDTIVILEDANGDGRADKTTVFADGLLIPTGLEHGDGGLYVGCGTQLLISPMPMEIFTPTVGASCCA